MDWPHRPVMPAEVVDALAPHAGGLYVDGTLGAGGHAEAVLLASAPDGRLLGLDRDPGALGTARQRLARFGDRVRLAQAPFDQTGRELAAWGVPAAHGILLDLGVSSMQLDQAGRGFSFRADGPLDMRMSGSGPSAADLVAEADQQELRRIFKQYGEEPLAGLMAKAIVKARSQGAISTTGRLAEVVQEAMPAAERRRRAKHPATQVFMALRLAVNDELGQLTRFLESAAAWLEPGGRLVIISYHSLEDRRVKQWIRDMADPCVCPPEMAVCGCGRKPLMTPLWRGARKPSPQEVAANPRARSARLRAAQRTGESL